MVNGNGGSAFEVKIPKKTVLMQIVLEQGCIRVEGPEKILNDKVVAYGILACAHDAIGNMFIKEKSPLHLPPGI